jgi:hypothetical protein
MSMTCTVARKPSLFCTLAVLVAFAPALRAQANSAPDPRQPGQLAGQFHSLTTRQKFDYRFWNTLSWRGLVGSAFGAGFDQIINSPKEWGQGIDGYGKRYASIFGGALTRQTLNFALETALHEDPRYFPLGGPSKKARIWQALSSTLVTRTDSGASSFAYGRVASAFATGQIVRSWQPASSSSFAYGVETGATSLGVDAAVNLIYEFIPSSRPKLVREP